MDRKLFKNYIYSSLYQIILLVTPLIMTPYLTRVMGAGVLSINTYTANIVGWFVIFGMLGIGNYGNKSIARVREDKKELSKTFIEIYLMQLMTLMISSIGYIIFINFIVTEYKLVYILQGITLISVALDIAWFFYGIEDLKKLTIRNIFVKLLGVALIFIYIKDDNDLNLFILINTISAVIGQLIMWLEVKKHLVFVKVSIKDIIRHIKPNIILFIPQIAISVYSLLDITMLGTLYDDLRYVNFYEQAIKLVKMFMFFITSIGTVMLARIAFVYANKNKEEINKYLSVTFRLAIYLSIPMIFGIAGLIENFISWFLPIEYQVVSIMIIYVSPIILFISISNVYGIQYMIPCGMNSEFSTSVCIGAIFNFFINLLLIPKYGAYGAIIGTILAELIVCLVQYYYVRNSLKLDFKFRYLINVIVSSIIMYLIVKYIGRLGNNFIINIIQALVGLSTYVLCLIVIKDDFIIGLINKVRRIND